MVKKLTKDELKEYMEELLEWGALELQIREDDKGMEQVFIPYVMNDAVECYLRLEGCQLLGEWNPDDDVNSVDVVQDVQNSERCGLILRQSENVVMIWYNHVIKELHPYQYHLIGHDWRSYREQGASEEWRRVMNLLCVIHDKYQYLGEAAVCEKEKRLRYLIEFAPFCYYTPIDDSILSWYPETEEGVQAAEHFARMAEDEDYALKVAHYREQIAKISGKRREKLIAGMAKELLRPEHTGILKLLIRKLEEASMNWEVRQYGIEQELQIRKLREQAALRAKAEGYCGEYPRMYKNSGEWVHFAEEHPFTVMESEEYEFKIFTISGAE